MFASQSVLSSLWRRPLRAASPHTFTRHDLHRAETEVGGKEIWFESPDQALAGSLEAIGSAFVIPAAARGKWLTFASPPDPVWLANAQRAQAIAADWWAYRRPAAIATSAGPATMPSTIHRRLALCFTCGVDSFYSLLCSGQPIACVLFVHGYDIDLADPKRAQAAEQSVRKVAAELGIRAILVRTNLRRHDLFLATNWEHTHGGALAAVGHLLSDHVNELLISASYPRVFDRPWGSHWKLDACWSSSRLTVTHVGAEKWRAEKLVSIMNESLVRQHLRVCWENRSPTGNCGQCEKCLRTMLVLDGHGRLGEFPVFPTATALADNLHRLSHLKQDLIRVYASFLEMHLSAKVHAALAALVERSRNQLNGERNRWWRTQRA